MLDLFVSWESAGGAHDGEKIECLSDKNIVIRVSS